MRLPSGLVVVLDAPPAYTCRICDAKFKEHETLLFTRHVEECYSRNESDVRSASLRERLPDLYGDESGDAEYRRWVRANKKGILTGDVRM